MAGFIGLAAGAAAGYLGQKHAEHMQEQQAHMQFMQKAYMDAIHADPTVINNEEWVKGGRKVFGEGWDDFIASQKPAAAAAMREQKQQQDMMNTLLGMHAGATMATGGGPPITQSQQLVRGGAPATLPPASIQPAQVAAPQAAPSPTDAFDAETKELQAAQLAIGQMKHASPEFIKSSTSVIEERLKQIEKDREKALAPSEAGAKKQAELDVENAPANVKAEAKRKGTVEGAGAAARISAETSPAATKAKVAQAEAIATVREKVKASVGKPWTEKDALDARSKALAQAKTELTKPNRILPGTTAPHPDLLKKRASEILLSEGLNPDNGQRMKDGDMIRLPDGRTLHWKSSP